MNKMEIQGRGSWLVQLFFSYFILTKIMNKMDIQVQNTELKKNMKTRKSEIYVTRTLFQQMICKYHPLWW